jgi:deoxyxylulose-5-phosphate synthase
MNAAMELEATDTIAAHALYGECAEAAIAEAQVKLEEGKRRYKRTSEAGKMMEIAYGALAAYAQQVMMRLRAEDPEAGGVDHSFRAGQAYGVSCVLNHLIDKLRDPTGIALEALDQFSDQMHEEILEIVNQVDLSVELLDAKGVPLDD